MFAAQVEAAPGVSSARPGKVSSLRLALSAGHEGVDHHLMTRENTGVVTSVLGEMSSHDQLVSNSLISLMITSHSICHCSDSLSQIMMFCWLQNYCL